MENMEFCDFYYVHKWKNYICNMTNGVFDMIFHLHFVVLCVCVFILDVVFHLLLSFMKNVVICEK